MQVEKGYKQTEVGVIPEAWDVTALGSISKIERGKFTARPRNDPKYYGGDIPFIQTGDVSNSAGVIKKYSQTLNELGLRVSKRFPRGTLFFTIAANIGDLAITEFDTACPDSLVAISPAKTINQRWLYHELKRNKSKFQIIASSNAQSNLNLEKIKPFLIPLPPTLTEQEAIAGALSDADAWIESLEQLIAKKRQIKQGAMQELLTGKRRLPGFSEKWIMKMLPEVIHFRGGKAHEQYIADNARYVCVNSKFISTEGKVRKYTTENFCSARKDDILMVMSDLPNGKALAKTFIADKDNLYAVNQRVCALTPREGYCSQFLAYVLDRNAYFLRFDDGVNQTHLLNRVFEKCPLIVPITMAEQVAIATIISDLNIEINSLESKLAKACKIKQGMMQELLTGKIRLI